MPSWPTQTSRPSGTSRPAGTSLPSQGNWPVGLETASFEQRFSVDAAPRTLGVISFNQSLVVDVTGGYGGYTPASEPGLVAWFDLLDAASYTTSGATITAIINKASGVTWTPSTPTPFEATGWNGKPCLHPTTVSHRIVSSEAAVVSALDCPTTAKPHTLVVYVHPDSVSAGGVIFGVGNTGVSSASTRTWGQRAIASGTWEYSQTAPAAVTAVRSTALVTLAKTVVSWDSSGVGLNCRINNGAQDPNHTTVDPSYTPGTGPNQSALFCRPDSSPDSGWSGLFCEAALYSGQLDAAALTRLYDYLTDKWA